MLSSAVLFLIMVWLFIAFQCIVSNTSCCIFNEFLHNWYSGSINNLTKVKMWNFHLWNYGLPRVFPGVILVHNKGEFSWLANFPTSLSSACAECTTSLGRKKETTTLCHCTESCLSPAFGENDPLWAVPPQFDWQQRLWICRRWRYLSFGAGAAAFRWHWCDSDVHRRGAKTVLFQPIFQNTLGYFVPALLTSKTSAPVKLERHKIALKMSKNFLSLDFEDNPVPLRFQALKFYSDSASTDKTFTKKFYWSSIYTVSHLQSSVFIIANFTVITL